MKRLTPLIIVILAACGIENDGFEGSWYGQITMQGKVLEFPLEVNANNAYLINDEEKIELGAPKITEDSVTLNLHIFDATLQWSRNNRRGFFRKNYISNYTLPFSVQSTPAITYQADTTFDGKWEVVFTDEDGKSSPAIGLFSSTPQDISGTFLTPLGDYRYLSGGVTGDSMRLSTFDGNHAYIFTAAWNDDTLRGNFYSGISGHETWKGWKNENASLPDPTKMTRLKSGYETVDFHFPDSDGDTISPLEGQYKNKVRILQILGTWCPNCMDETRYLADFYKKTDTSQVAIIGLAFEQKDNFEYAATRVKKMKSMWEVAYPVVIAGTSDKADASSKLPMLEEVLAFPTLIVLDKQSRVRWIHTGFNGPGTGLYFEEFKTEFELLIEKLQAE